VAATDAEQPAGGIGQLEDLRSGQLRGKPDRRTFRQDDERGGHLAGRDRLHPQPRHQCHRPVPAIQDLAGELVELGRPQHAGRQPTGQHEFLLPPLAGVVAGVDPVDADDRHRDVMADTGPLAGGQQLPGRLLEEPDRGVAAQRRDIAHVDHRRDPAQRVVQPDAGGDVDPGRAGERDGLITAVPQRLDDVGAHGARPPGYSDLHDAHSPSCHWLVLVLTVLTGQPERL
jgi:hypothetical protein